MRIYFFLGVLLASFSAFAQGPSGPKSASSQPSDSYDELMKAREQASSVAQKAELSVVWLLDHPDHPKAAEVRATALVELGQLRLALSSSQGPDAIFLADLLIIFDPSDETKRVAAVQSLATSHDERAIVPLIYASRDFSTPIRKAVAVALGEFIDPRVEETLIRMVGAIGDALEVRIAAAASLGKQKTESAGDALLAVFANEDNPKEIREASRTALLEYFPDKLSADENVLDRRGRFLLVGASSLFGGYALATVGILGQNDAGIAIGSFGGLLLGGSAAYFLTQKENMPLSQSTYLTTGGAWGLGVGLGLGVILDENLNVVNDDSLIAGIGLAGEAAGLLGTLATRKSPFMIARTETDHIEANFTGGLGLLTARGINVLRDDFADLDDEAALSASMGLASLVAMEVYAPKLSFSAQDLLLMSVCGYEGAFYGGLSPFLEPDDEVFFSNFERQDRRARAFVSIGISAGVAGCGLLSQKMELPKKDAAEIFVADSFGKILGVGLPLMFGAAQEESFIAGTLIGGAATMTAGAVLAPRLEFSKGDTVLTSFGAGLGALQGLGLSFGFSGDEDEEVIFGSTLVGFSLGGLGGMALSQKIDLTAWEALWLNSGAFWGLWFSSFYTLLDNEADADLSDDFLLILGATDLGLASTIAMLSPKVGVHPTKIGIATLGGLTGATVASLGTALFALDGDKIITANLIGSAVGLGVGALLAARYEVKPPSPKTAQLGLPKIKAPQLSTAPLIPMNQKDAPPMALVLRW